MSREVEDEAHWARRGVSASQIWAVKKRKGGAKRLWYEAGPRILQIKHALVSRKLSIGLGVLRIYNKHME